MERLSKSRYQTGLQCERALWRQIHARETADPVTEVQQWIFDQGTEVGRVAQGLFPGGIEVAEDHSQTAQALEATQRLLTSGATVLYEPAFEHDGVLVRVDVLVRAGGAGDPGLPDDDIGLWNLYEVKSSSSLKPQHVTDAAIQTYVVEGAGLRVGRSQVVHLDKSYTYGGGVHDPDRLFTIADVTADVRAYLPSIPATLRRFQEMLAELEPDIRIGSQCSSPYTCSFFGHCHAFLPAEHPVTDLPRLSEALLHRLLDSGMTSIRDIPADFTGLTPTQRKVVEVVRRGEPHIDVAGLASDLAGLEWPVYHLDFETVAPALPLWPGTRPYEPVSFQYSVHVHHRDGTHEHREHLHTGDDDPRAPLAMRLLGDLGEAGSIVHYSSYEKRILNGLSDGIPELAGRFEPVYGRLFDLEGVFRRRLRHPAACGRTSIKYVLPAWCPDLSYADMEIRDGQTASVRYLRALRGMMPPHEVEKLHADLRAYCGLDTYATVRLLDEIVRLAAT